MICQANIVINGDNLTWNGDGTLTGEASDVGYRNYQRLYDDAIDVGFWMERNGSMFAYAMIHVEENDGDICWWDFEIIPEHEKKTPIKRIRLFND